MAAGYGYKAPTFGYQPAPKTPKVQPYTPLQLAASGKTTSSDPFGLLTDTTDSARVARANPSPAPAPHTSAPQVGGAPAPQTGGAPNTPAPGAPVAPVAYDINTDPALQTVNALTGMSDEQARAQALKQKQDALLGYGDPHLVQALLGDSTLAQAAGANPTSQLAQLGHQRDTNTHNLTESLNKENLLYSGARVNQENEAAQQYQNALASAASGVNQGIGGIDSQLAQALGANQSQRIQAMLDAESRHATDRGYDPNHPDGGTGVDTGPLTDITDPEGLGLGISGPDYQNALALAARTRRSVAV